MNNLQKLAETICESKQPWTSTEISRHFGYSPQYSCMLMRQLQDIEGYVSVINKQDGKRTVSVYNCLGEKPLSRQQQLFRLVVFGTPVRFCRIAF